MCVFLGGGGLQVSMPENFGNRSTLDSYLKKLHGIALFPEWNPYGNMSETWCFRRVSLFFLAKGISFLLSSVKVDDVI